LSKVNEKKTADHEKSASSETNTAQNNWNITGMHDGETVVTKVY